jgi:Domain of unknown function (DUF6471)
MEKGIDGPPTWHKDAANFLKAELARSGIGYEALCERLKAIGVDESYKGVANKINRGSFSFAFFMQCMKAIGRNEIHI